DLGEVAAGVRVGKQCEFAGRRASDAENLALESAAGIGVDLDVRFHARFQPGDVGFLDVGFDPDGCRIMEHQDALSDRDVFALADEGFYHTAVVRTGDDAVGNVDIAAADFGADFVDLACERRVLMLHDLQFPPAAVCGGNGAAHRSD